MRTYLSSFFRKYGFYLALCGCLCLIGGAAVYARHAPRLNAPAPTQSAAPAATPQAGDDFGAQSASGVPDVVETLEDVKNPLSWPVAGREALSPMSDTPVWSDTLGQWQTHAGVDLAAEQGEAVYAAASGTVKAAFRDALLGYVIELQHENGLMTRYANLVSTDLVRVGDKVAAGQAIAAVGKSAVGERESRSHLHFEAYQDGKWVELPR